MKTLFLTLIAALTLAAPIHQAFAEDDDVFLDDGGTIDEPPGAGVALPETAAEDAAPVLSAPGGAATATKSAGDDGFGSPFDSDENAGGDEDAAPAKPAKAKKAKAAKTAKADKPAASKTRKPASKEGFRTLKADCPMHESASGDSAVLITVKGDRKLWIEDHDANWVKGFRKNGHGYMSRDCFE